MLWASAVALFTGECSGTESRCQDLRTNRANQDRHSKATTPEGQDRISPQPRPATLLHGTYRGVAGRRCVVDAALDGIVHATSAMDSDGADPRRLVSVCQRDSPAGRILASDIVQYSRSTSRRRLFDSRA